jgi:MinD superfamily P-loop ATPase
VAWDDTDRGLVLALLEERAETCSSCGHPTSVCRDHNTAGHWDVVEDTCEASRVAEAVMENNVKAEVKRRGLIVSTRFQP